ncbi:unnamed protein product [Notodromas monacha]|uniref:Protein Red n=1 Tax=Notodromas monacha TaxID=399045 RepID=A0A7R9BDR2_9CRUS|nr:unnamed protein product [Notodromas monacha]CAG0913512.1 unnamed protein product [Notodromas monacha]
MPDNEAFMNPVAPPGYEDHNLSQSVRNKLSNADFRKLLMTPRSTAPSATATPGLGATQSHHGQGSHVHQKIDIRGGSDAKAENRRKKKQTFLDLLIRTLEPYKYRITEYNTVNYRYYAKLKKQEDDVLADLAKKYRDRAAERREDIKGTEESDTQAQMAGGYRAVAPDAKSGLDKAERRRQMIQESKFLGGDMEHTHLVKGLDYALLQKVRSEIEIKEKVEEEELEALADVKPVPNQKPIPRTTVPAHDKADEPQFRTKIGRNIHRLLFDTVIPERNELFLPGRMAYVKAFDEPIFNDAGDYDPHYGSDKKKPIRDKDSYFDKPVAEMEAEERRKEKEMQDKYDWKNIRKQKEVSDAVVNEKKQIEAEKKRQKQIMSRLDTVGYAECYPGLEEMNDAIEDSDDEADYTKMDMGNKKGPVGRWDFDTQEEYSDYMSQKEALPKAAFQYGVKMADGRKSKKLPKNDKNERAELDREWKKIQGMLEKRKAGGGSSSGKLVVYSCLMVFTALFALKLDGSIKWSFWTVFLPLWIWKLLVFAGGLVGSIVWLKSQARREGDMDVEFKAMIVCLGMHVLLVMFEVLVCAQLESGSKRYLWTLTFVPLLLLSLVSIAVCLWAVKHDRAFELELFCSVNVVQFVFLALKLDGYITWSWEVVFIPLWIIMCVSLVAVLYSLVFASLLWRTTEVNQHDRRASLHTAIAYAFLVLPTLVFQVCSPRLRKEMPIGDSANHVLLANKLDGQEASFSFLAVVTPLFVSFATLIFLAFESKSGNHWWFGIRKDFCQFLLGICPCLQEYGNVSYSLQSPSEGRRSSRRGRDSMDGNTDRSVGNVSRLKKPELRAVMPVVHIDMPD